jgi:hypothetical protein
MLSNVYYNTANGGLGITAQGEDHYSAMLFSIAPPSLYGAALKAKPYNAIEDVVNDGIVKGDATYGVVHYHAKEFFRLSPGGQLWLCFNVNTPQEFLTVTSGKVRQLATTVSDLAEVQSVWQAFANTMAIFDAPVQVLLGYTGTFDPITCPDLSLSNSPNVSVVVVGDANYDGKAIATALGVPYIPCIGAVLGAMSKAKVCESIAWVGMFNFSDGRELERFRLADGTNDYPNGLVSQLKDKRYLVLKKHIGIGGSFMEHSRTATTATDDYGTIQNNRVIQKAKRNIRIELLHFLNSNVTLDAATGKLSPASINFFKDLTSKPLRQMQGDNEISGYTVHINPAQNVAATGKLYIQVRIQPRPNAEFIYVNIGYEIPGF